jgi:3-hydroxyacyl-[acyl-carrier-protein] dehydratase
MIDVDHAQLLALIPHRPPILMLDEVVGVVPGERGSGVRSFAATDSDFFGHFPGNPILPGVLTIEAFAQTALVVSILDQSRGQFDASQGRLAKCREMAFMEPIFPDMKVVFSIVIERRVGRFIFVSCSALAKDVTVATGKLTLKM